MSPERWNEIEALYHEVADLATDAQEARLAACADAELVREVRSLLRAGSVQTMVAKAVASVAESAAAPPVPQRFGPWRVTGVAGSGGMGAVYKAERDDRAFDRQVAIKVLHLGMDTHAARERFRQERRILAELDHPNIARLLDGGETDTGLSYIVMEYVDGEPIVDYCVHRNLPRAARLRLFLLVCSAVHLAHQKLVIHRDLKPGNILVTRDGVPKLLDFGIAKLLEPSALQTITGFLALTPQYASPEQIRGESVTTASDVYSLGMVLYEMLTGRRAYEVDSTRITEIARVVCDTAPAAPQLDADLNNILLMALRKEPARRYSSVQDFAADVERALTHRPVQARPASLGYRASKFVRRNRAAVAAGILVFGSLTGGLVATTRAQRLERARFNQVRKLATSFLTDFDRDIRQLPGSTAARERLVSTALDTLENLAKNAGSDPELAAELAQAYISVGEVQGGAGSAGLGHTDRAEISYRKAVGLARPLAARSPLTANPYRRLASLAHHRLGFLLWRVNRTDEARRWIFDGLVFVQPAIDGDKAEAQDYRLAANGNAYLSAIERQSFHGKLASEHAAKAVDYMRRFQSLTPGMRARSDLAGALTVGGSAAGSAGDLRRAEALLQEGIEMRVAIHREAPADVENRREWAIAELQLAGVEFATDGPHLGNAAAALEARATYLRLMRELFEADPRNDSARHDLALGLKEAADAEETAAPRQAEADLREAIQLLESRPPTAPSRDRHIGLACVVLGGVLNRHGRRAEGQELLARGARFFAQENPRDSLARGDFIRLWYEQKDYAKEGEALSPSIPGAAEDIDMAYQLADCALRLARVHPEATGEWKSKSAAIWAPRKGRYPAADRGLVSDRPVK